MDLHICKIREEISCWVELAFTCHVVSYDKQQHKSVSLVNTVCSKDIT